MNDAFLQFNDKAIGSGALKNKPDLVRELKQTTETFVRLAKDAAKSADLDDEEQEDHVEDQPSKSALIKHRTERLETVTTRESHETQEEVHIGWGYTRIIEQESPQSESPEKLQLSPHLSNSASSSDLTGSRTGSILPFGLVPGSPGTMISDAASQFDLRIPSPTLGHDLFNAPNLTKTATLPAPFTYSFQESNFARRLQRATLERAYHLLSTSHRRPNVYKHVFRLLLLTCSREELLSRSRILLSNTNMESLYYWQSPYLHLGGAGTHYPERDANGNVIARPNSWTVQGMGPFAPTVKLFNSQGTVHEANIDLRGYEGEWFDPHDVQGYLEEEMRCEFVPHSSFANAWVDDVDPILSILEADQGPLTMDLGMGNVSDVDTISLFPSVTRSSTLNNSARNPSSTHASMSSLSHNSSGSASVIASTSTPPTPTAHDAECNMSYAPSLDRSYLTVSPLYTTAENSNDQFNTTTSPTGTNSANKFTNSTFPGPSLYDSFSFDAGGMFDGGNNTDFDNFLSNPNSHQFGPKITIPGVPQPKKQVTVDIDRLVKGELLELTSWSYDLPFLLFSSPS